jgi:hypothetical protein
MMPISDSAYLGLEARGTAGSTIIQSAILTLAIALAQHPVSRLDSGESTIRLVGTEESLTQSFLLQPTEMEWLLEMNRIYDDLLKNQVELDIEAKQALYSNLWDLYS